MRLERDWKWWFFAAMFLLLSGANAQTCCNPPVTGIPRTGGGTDGSAQWALAIAQPKLQGCAPDIELRMVIGVRVASNGRLFTNVGSWGIVGYSPSLQQDCQVNVSFDGTSTVQTRANAAPGPGVVKPLPPTFADSTVIFAAAVARGGAGAESTLTMLNHVEYTGHPGKSAWAVNFSNANYWFDASGNFLGN